MNKKVFDRVGHALSVNLYNMGNRLDISHFKVTHEKNRIKTIHNDKKALAEDWISVGKEVELALDKLKKSHRKID